MQLYYRIANSVAFRIYVHGLDHQDKVQECVIKAWLALGEKPASDMGNLIYTIMKNHLIALSRPTYNDRRTIIYEEDMAIYSKCDCRIVIPLPKDKDERIIVVALLENEGRLSLACEALGIRYRHGLITWNAALKTLSEKNFEDFFLEEQQCFLNGY